MRIIKFTLLIVFCSITSGQVFAKDIERYFNNATINTTNFMSSFSCTDKDRLCEREVRIWISKHKSYFYFSDSVVIKSEVHWVYGARHQMITKVNFVTAANGPKRKNYFDKLKREKEEQRLAEIKRKEDALKAEADRLKKIKKEIENGLFTGTHFYEYPEGRYEGAFVNGKRQGYGKLIYANKTGHYEGYFSNDKKHGKGKERLVEYDRTAIIQIQIGLVIEGNYVNGYRNGIFSAYQGTLLTGYDEWKIEFDMGKVVSTTITNSDYTGFIDGLSENSNDESENTVVEIEKSKPIAEDCEQKYQREFNSLNQSQIKYGAWEKDNSLALSDQYQRIEFPDGTIGKVYQGRETKRYFLSLGGTSEVYYVDYKATVKALYIYKKCGIVPNLGKN